MGGEVSAVSKGLRMSSNLSEAENATVGALVGIVEVLCLQRKDYNDKLA